MIVKDIRMSVKKFYAFFMVLYVWKKLSENKTVNFTANQLYILKYSKPVKYNFFSNL